MPRASSKVARTAPPTTPRSAAPAAQGAPHGPAEPEPSACACGCGVAEAGTTDGRKAVAVDPGIKARNLTRLRRIEGQVRGLQKMVEEDRYCADVMTQVSSVHEALRSVGRELMRNHLRHCASAAIRGAPAEADAMYDELVDLMYTHAR